jgi:hypothetical protein
VSTTGALASLQLCGCFAFTEGGRTLALPRKAQAQIALFACHRSEPLEREARADIRKPRDPPLAMGRRLGTGLVRSSRRNPNVNAHGFCHSSRQIVELQ